MILSPADSLKLQVFELAPSTNQIVFAGDKLPFHCRASIVDHDTNMSWLHNDKLIVSNRTLGIFIHDESLPNQMLLTTMVLERLTISHTGSWKCLVESAKGRAAKSVSIVVLAENTGYCTRTVTKTSRGTYAWPKTLAGIVQELSCEIAPNGIQHGSQNAVARHKCDVNGAWTGLDVTQCSFTSQKTRELEAIYFSLVSFLFIVFIWLFLTMFLNLYGTVRNFYCSVASCTQQMKMKVLPYLNSNFWTAIDL